MCHSTRKATARLRVDPDGRAVGVTVDMAVGVTVDTEVVVTVDTEVVVMVDTVEAATIKEDTVVDTIQEVDIPEDTNQEVEAVARPRKSFCCS